MASKDNISVQLGENLKNEASEILHSMGMSISQAVKLFMVVVVNEKKLPFEIKSYKTNEIDN